MNMRILHIIHRYWPAYGGSEQYMQVLSEHFASRGHDVTVWTTDALAVERLWAPNHRAVSTPEETHHGVLIRRFPVRHLPCHRYAMRLLGKVPLGKYRFLHAPGSPRVPDLVREAETTRKPFDLIHVTPFPYDSLLYAAGVLAKKRGIPLICTPFAHLGEGPESPVRVHYSRPHQIEFLQSADAVFVQTVREKTFLMEKGVPKSAIRKMGVGIDLEKISGGREERFRIRYDVDEPIVGFIGVRCRDKGALDLIRAGDILRKKGLRVRTVLLGASVREFDREFAELPEETRESCLILDDVSEERKKDFLEAVSLLALPSRTDSFGIVLLEAWACGKPVIVADAGGPGELVEDEINGLHVPYGDPATLAQKIEQVLSDPEEARRMGRAGRKKIEAGYQWRDLLPEFEECYRNLAERNSV